MNFFGHTATWASSAVYALLFALAMSYHGAAKRLQPLAALGRMTLTTYLTQSLVCTFVFYNWGLGLMNRINVTGIFLFTLGLFSLADRIQLVVVAPLSVRPGGVAVAITSLWPKTAAAGRIDTAGGGASGDLVGNAAPQMLQWDLQYCCFCSVGHKRFRADGGGRICIHYELPAGCRQHCHAWH